MRIWIVLAGFVVLQACGGLAFDTRVADSQATRFAMIESVSVGDTTETQFVTRWGNPFQKVRDGGRVEYIYRSRAGDGSNFVIVTFEYGVAIAVRSNETEGCRASFAPRVPGYAADTPDIVKPIGWCADPSDPYDRNEIWRNLTGQEAGSGAGSGSGGQLAPWQGVSSDDYVPGAGSLK